MLCITNCFSMWSNGSMTRNLGTEGKIFISLCTKIHNIMLASVPAFVPCVDTIDLLVYPGNIWCLVSPKHHCANINFTLQHDCNADIIPIPSGETEAKSPSCQISTEPVSLLQSGLQNFCLLLPLLLQRDPPWHKKYVLHAKPGEKSLFQKKKGASRWLIVLLTHGSVITHSIYHVCCCEAHCSSFK